MKLLGILVLAIMGIAVTAWGLGVYKLQPRSIDPALTVGNVVPSADGAALASAYGCTGCHGQTFTGTEPFPIPAAIATVVAPALAGTELTLEEWSWAVHRGLDTDRRPLLLMPAQAYSEMPIQDIAAIHGWAKALQPSREKLAESKPGLVGTILMGLGIFPLPTDHIDPEAIQASIAQGPAIDPLAYGRTLTGICADCHGEGLVGREPGSMGPPPGPDLKGSTALTAEQGWTRQTFAAFFQTGVLPNGEKVGAKMPWQAMSAGLSGERLDAVWAYLQTL